ncbi:MAG: hypothetical protein HQK77_10220 [Desulfobacterales bacterium]|nr:hypothetical protein [Desulfobacterales bacterium]
MYKKLFIVYFTLMILFGFGEIGMAFSQPDDIAGLYSDTNTHESLNVFKIIGKGDGLLKINQSIFYPGNHLSLKIVFPRSLKFFWEGKADAHLVIRLPNKELIVNRLVIENEQPDSPKTFFDVDLGLDTIPEGIYHLSLILTEKNGDPLNLKDWYNGFAGIVSVAKLKFKSVCDIKDMDCDGVYDNATDEENDIADEMDTEPLPPLEVPDETHVPEVEAPPPIEVLNQNLFEYRVLIEANMLTVHINYQQTTTDGLPQPDLMPRMLELWPVWNSKVLQYVSANAGDAAIAAGKTLALARFRNIPNRPGFQEGRFILMNTANTNRVYPGDVLVLNFKILTPDTISILDWNYERTAIAPQEADDILSLSALLSLDL